MEKDKNRTAQGQAWRPCGGFCETMPSSITGQQLGKGTSLPAGLTVAVVGEILEWDQKLVHSRSCQQHSASTVSWSYPPPALVLASGNVHLFLCREMSGGPASSVTSLELCHHLEISEPWVPGK